MQELMHDEKVQERADEAERKLQVAHERDTVSEEELVSIVLIRLNRVSSLSLFIAGVRRELEWLIPLHRFVQGRRRRAEVEPHARSR